MFSAVERVTSTRFKIRSYREDFQLIKSVNNVFPDQFGISWLPETWMEVSGDSDSAVKLQKRKTKFKKGRLWNATITRVTRASVVVISSNRS